MVSKKRSPLQVSDNFLNKLKDLQVKIRKSTGKERSLRDLTEDLTLSGAFDDVETKILKKANVNIDVCVRFDKRYNR